MCKSTLDCKKKSSNDTIFLEDSILSINSTNQLNHSQKYLNKIS